MRGYRLLGVGTIVLCIVLWELGVRLSHISRVFMVPPSTVSVEIYRLFADYDLAGNLWYSCVTLAVGFGAAVIAGVVVGLLLGWYRTVYYAFDLLLTMLYVIPVIVLMPLVILWIGLGRSAQETVVFLAGFFPIAFTVSAGVRSTDRALIRAGRAYGASDWALFRDVALPSSLPHALSGMRIALARCLVTLIFVEWFSGSRGVGFLLATYGQQFDTAKLLGVLVTVMAVSVVLTLGMRALEHAYFERTGTGRASE